MFLQRLDLQMLRLLALACAIQFTLPLELLSGYDFSHDAEGWRASSIGGAPGGASQSFSGASADVWASPDGTLVVDPAGVHDGRVAVIDSPMGAFVPLADDVFAVLRLRTRLSTGGASGANAACFGALFWSTHAPLSGISEAEAASRPFGRFNETAADFSETFPTAPGRVFSLRADGRWHVYAVPLSTSRVRMPRPMPPSRESDSFLTQLRFFSCFHGARRNETSLQDNMHLRGASMAAASIVSPGTRAEIDWLKIYRAPTLYRVEGCARVEGVAATALQRPFFRSVVRNAAALARFFTNGTEAVSAQSASSNSSLPWAAAYNCDPRGGERIYLRGENFGLAPPLVRIGGSACVDVRVEEPHVAVSCTSPAGTGANVEVQIVSRDAPPLSDSKPFFSYAQPAPPPAPPVVANIAAHSVELAWAAPGDAWAQRAITGYVIQWRSALIDDDTVVGPTSTAGDGPAEASRVRAGAVDAVDGLGLRVTPPSAAVEFLRAPVPLSSAQVSPALLGETAPGRRSQDPAADPAPPNDGSVPLGAYEFEAPPPNIFSNGASATGPEGTPFAALVGWGPWGASPGGGEAVVCNQTQTTLRRLEAGVRYQFRVAALSEPTHSDTTWASCDSFGHRESGSPSPGALRGAWSLSSVDTRTLVYDVFFGHFDANASLDFGPLSPASLLNSAGWAGGEGHYGLSLIGAAHIAGCNNTHACCDGFGGKHFLDVMRWLLEEDDPLPPDSEPGGSTVAGAWRPSGSPNQPLAAPHLWRWSAHASEWLPLAARDAPWSVAREAADAQNSGTLSSYYSRSSAFARQFAVESGAFAARDLLVYAAGSEAESPPEPRVPGVSAGRVVISPDRLFSLDSLLGRALGTLPVHGWFSALKQERAALWDGYDDSGGIFFLPSSRLAELQKEWATDGDLAARIAAVIGVAPYGVAWAGNWSDARVAPSESFQKDDFASAWATADDDGARIQSSSRADTHVRPGRTDYYPKTLPRERKSTFGDDDGSITDDDPILRGKYLSGAAPGFGDDDENTGLSTSHDNAAARIYKTYPQSAADAEALSSASSGRRERKLAGSGARPAGADMPRDARPAIARGRRALRDAAGRRLVGWPYPPTSTCSLVCASSASLLGAPIDLDGATFENDDSDSSGPYGRGWQAIFGAAAPREGNCSAACPTPPPLPTARVTGRLSRVDAAGAGNASDRVPRPASSGFRPSVAVARAASANESLSNATAPCGPALRLTASHSSSVGAAWYGRPLDVRGGFETSFVFRLSSPSLTCRTHDSVASRCRSRGGAGFAFVVQTASPGALGNGTRGGLGYAGIGGALAVEFDTSFEPSSFDPGESHVAVLARGARFPASANHSFALGSAVAVPDLADGTHAARVAFLPRGLVGRSSLASSPAFLASAHVQSMMEDARHAGAAWTGAIAVYLDGSVEPSLVVPADIAAFIGTDATHGRAWVGFTAATGADEFQTHDVLAWHFSSLRED